MTQSTSFGFAVSEIRDDDRAEEVYVFPASFAQQRLWLLDQLEPSSTLYNITSAVSLDGPLDLEALSRTFDEIIRRHEVLRTTFSLVDEQPVQLIGPPRHLPLVLEDLSQLPEAEAEAEAGRLLRVEADKPFDLSRGPLLRVMVVRLSATRHVIIFSMHHIISDGWSMDVLQREVSVLYGSYARGLESPLAELEIQYADYAVWQREWLQGEVLETELGYWRKQLGGTLPELELGTGTRPAVQSHQGAAETFEVAPATARGLKELSGAQGVTLYMTLLAAFQTLLYRYSGQEDIVVGSPIAGRNRAELEPLIGFFVNTLVLRTDLSGEPAFVELLKRVQEAALGAYAHQEVPFEKLVEELQPERDPSRSPLFQVAFVLQSRGQRHEPGGQTRRGDLRLKRLATENATAKFDLTLLVEEAGESLIGTLEYQTDLFTGESIRRMVAHWQQLLSAIVAQPQAKISRLEMLSAAERQQLLVEWNETAIAYPRESCIHELFEAQVERTPQASAVIFGDRELSYAELNARANQLAHHLRSLGVGPEVLVGICAKRSLEMVVGLLGILKAGGAYVPLDPEYPAERLRFMIDDAAVRVLLTQEELLPELAETRVVSLDGDWSEIASLESTNLKSAVQAGNPAYVIYTSGSTGRPNGVSISHAGLANLVHWHQEAFAITAADRVPQVAGTSFDASAWEIWPALTAGASLHLAPEAVRVSAVELRDWLLAEEITVGFVPTPLAELLLGLSWPSESQLRLLLTGGGPLRQYPEERHPFTLVNNYGPTEGTVVSTSGRIGCAAAKEHRAPSIGKAIANVQVYLLDQELEPVPVGVAGELYVGGAGLARGYHNGPALTATRFVPDVFGVAGGRLFKTGDVARWRADGELEFIGRVDGQVKVRGYRIELGEIESVLLRHEGVSAAAVITREEAGGEKRLVGYVVAEAEELSTANLREYLMERLPGYMVPSALVQLAELPLTPNGKVDRKALGQREDVGERAEEIVLPRTAVEELLASIWAGVLRVERVGIEENFFALGGHSLLATQVMSRVREVFGVEVPLRSLFEQPTVAGLGAKIEAALRGERGVAAPPLVRVSRERELPLSFAQQRLWFLDQLEPASAFYNVPTAVRLQGELNVAALEQTLTEIVRRHEVLRTTFASINGTAVQVIGEAQPQRIPVTELSGPEEAQELIDAEARTPFDLSTGPLLRVRLLRLGAEEHIVLLTMHHIVSDGWSMGLLLNEIATLYRSFTRGEEPELPELPIQYADYAVWQREWLQGEVLEAELAYWREQLGGELPVLELPTDRVRPAVQSHRGAQLAFHLSKDLSQSLQQLSHTQGCTLFMTLLAAFQTLLYRYSGQEEIAVGSPIAGRNRVEIEKLIGFFVNTLVLRTDLSGGPTFVELLKRVREVALGAYAHQEVPFEKLVEELQPERDLSRSPLFQVMFTLQNADTKAAAYDAEKNREAGLMLNSLGGKSETAKFDLSLSVVQDGAGLHCAVGYSTDLFDEVTIKRMGQHFQTLLSGLTADPRQQLGMLPLLSAAEQEQLLVEWNQTAVPFPRELCLHQLFEAQAELQPESVALVFGDRNFSYRQLNEQANQLAHYLREQGVGPETLVGLCVERSPAMVLGMLAILKAGGAYVPLDPEYPRERLKYMIADCAPALVLTQQSLDAAEDLLRRYPTDNPRRAAVGLESTNLAYVIYTSGSTGKPKGAMLEHRGVVNCMESMQRVYQLEPSDRFLARTSLNFDPSVWEILWTLSTGAVIVLAGPEAHFDPAYLKHLIIDEAVTTAYFVPSLLSQFVAEAGVEQCHSLKRVISGGESLAPQTIDRFHQLLEADLYHSYGPTETSISASEWSCPRVKETAAVAIGRPLGNARLYVLDKWLQPVPLSVAGELYIGGAGVGRGYLKRPELTAERFIPDPFSAEAGARLYRTGDVVRYWSDGNLEFIGRVDQQVKVRGNRIELGEIESVLLGHGSVREAVVVARGDGSEKRLVGYVVAEAEELSTADLREYLMERLPSYMVPSALVQLAELPLTPNGKVDRKALAQREDVSERAEESMLPRTAVEELLASIWAGVLRVEGVGVEENFFALGGHSLLATQVMSRVREVFGVEVPLRSLFEQPTVAGLAVKIEAALRGERGVAAPALEKVSRERELPLSFAQQRLWFLDQLEPGSAFYNVPTAVRLQGELNVEALERTLTEIVRRHEVLRTTFASVNGEAVQVIGDAQRLEIPVTEVSAWEEARELIDAEAQTPFDLSTGPLLRVRVLRLAAQEHVVLLTMHHIVSDGWSMSLLLNEIATLYRSFTRGEEPELPELPIQYADYAVWQREWLQGEVLEAELSYWREQLDGELSGLALPTDRVRPAVQSYRGAQLAFHLSKDLSQSLQQLSRHHGCTLFMTLLAAFQTLLYRYSGQEEIAVGSPIAGRNRVEIEKLIGFFVNTLVLRTDLSGGPTFVELLKRVREVALGAYAHQEVPFEKLVEELQPERDLSRSPLFQVMFTLQNMDTKAAEPDAETNREARLMLNSVGGKNETAKFDLSLSVVADGAGIAGAVEYSTDLFDEVTIKRLVEHFQQLLSAVADDPRQQIGLLPLLSPAEQAQLLVEWNNTALEYPRGLCMHQLFEAQVERQPEAMALRCGAERLSYRELNERANRVAQYLVQAGVQAEDRVGILMERSAAMIVALLGVLKASGCYVPLDPQYPRERLEFMQADAGLRVLLTTGGMAARCGLAERAAVQWVCVEEIEQGAAAQCGNVEVTVSEQQLAYLIYTSGSTGVPKGVAITHGNANSFIHWAQTVFAPEQLRGVLCATSICFDLSIFEIFVTLSSGGELLLVDNVLQLASLPAASAAAVTLVNTVPSAMTELLRLGAVPPSVAVVNLAGEALPAELVAAIYAQTEVQQVYNLYGPSEATTYSTYTGLAAGERVTIGRPIANTRAHVLDKQLQLAPVGVAGELYLGGAGVARGYWQRAALTGSQFVPDHVSGVAGARLYRTGDLVKWRADGELEFLGRADQQVKVRGYRIELGEVESALRQQEQVRKAVVLVRGSSGEQRLVGYVVAAEGGRLNVTELRAALQRQLPEYMTPAAFVQLAELPLTPNGKVDRKALALREDVGERAEESVLPRTAVEELLASIWAGVLRVEGVGVEENFFALGGHSLLATQVMSRVREVFGIELPLRGLFEQPTVAALAGKIEQALRGERGVAAPPLEKVSRERELPLSFAQQRLWFLDQLEPGSAFYNVPTAVRLQGELNVEALEQTLTEIVRRHEVLRTVFQSVNGEAVQVIREAQPLEIPVTEVSAWEEARELIDAEAQTPFDLSTGPLLRVKVLRLGAEEHIALLTMHHIVSDGWSMGLLLNEVATLYRAYSAGEESPLSPLPIQYADYAVWQREWLQGEVLEAELGYWRQQLGGELSGLALPTDRVRPAVQSYRGAQLAFHLSRDLSQSLHELSRSHGCTLFMTLLAAFQTLLYRYSGQEEIAVGSPIAGRNRVEIEKLIGFFVNTLVLRTDLSGGPTFVELLKRVREVALGAYTHQEVPFEKLVEELQPERDLSRSPLFQVMFTLQNAAATTTGHAEGTTPHLHLSSLGGEHESAKFDLSVFISETSTGLAGNIEYSTDLFDAATIKRMMRHFETLLNGVVENPQQEIGLLPLLSDEELLQLLLEWNETATQSPRESCIHELFEAQVERTPEALAVVFEDQQLTYTELNTRANQLARHLQSLGVGAETLVGLCVERSLEMVVGLLGILKAGGAYVPLDPEYPAERLRFTLEDAAISLVLTQEHLQNKLTLLTRIVRLDGEWNEIARHAQDNPKCTVAADNLAYVSYTSGSTGRPKGVSIPHRAVVSLLCPSEFVRLDERETLLQMAPLPFDASTLEVWGSLLNGARLVVMPAGQPTLEEIGAALRAELVTTLWLTAGLFHLMVDEQLDALAQVRQMLAGGDVLSVEHSRKYLAAAGADSVLVNGYGPTESTTFTTCDVLRDAAELQMATSVAIGKVVGGRRAYVVDERGELVGQGIWGELYIGGAGLGRGYVQRAAETAERFVPDRWSGEWGGRLYRTGDVVRWKDDGKLEFKGRADGQVKLRGYRIEVGEIEAALLDHGGVREAVVVVREDDGEKRLVGYVVAEAEESELRDYLAQRLPKYMVPSALVLLPELPLTPNGKVDRRLLLETDLDVPDRPNSFVAPRTLTELQLVRMWEDILGLDQVSVHDNFFELGGHSLLAVRLMTRIRKETNKHLPLEILFRAQTVEQLATHLRNQTSVSNGPLVKLQDGTRRPFFCVHPVGGNVLCYAELSRALGVDQTFYGIQAPPPSEPPASIKQMARSYVDAILTVQPHGPYLLGGWSMGGLIAFEMARALERKGETVSLLALIDPTPPKSNGHVLKDDELSLLMSFAQDLGVELNPETWPTQQLQQLQTGERLSYLHNLATSKQFISPDLGLPEVSAIFEVFKRNITAIKTYKPAAHAMKTILFRAREGVRSEERDETAGWAGVVGNDLEVHVVPGNHYTIMRAPQVKLLGDKLRELLAQS